VSRGDTHNALMRHDACSTNHMDPPTAQAEKSTQLAIARSWTRGGGGGGTTERAPHAETIRGKRERAAEQSRVSVPQGRRAGERDRPWAHDGGGAHVGASLRG